MSKSPTKHERRSDASEEQLEGLMAAEQELVDLDTAAWDAAEQWIADNEELAPETEAAAPEASAGAGPEAASAPARHWTLDRLLQVMLLGNLVLLAAMLLVPSGTGDATPALAPAPDASDAAPGPDPFVSPPRVLGALPEGALWDESVRAAGDGDYATAVELLGRYLATARAMSDLERRLVYNQLAFYLTKDGRLEEAQEYERRSHQLMARSHLPDDLLRSARRAAEQGQIDAMRSAYARLLLQQKQIPPTLRRTIAEAYLQLGESYRSEAQRAGASEVRR